MHRRPLVSALAVLCGLAFGPHEVRAESEDELEVDIFFEPAETVTSATLHEQPLEQSPSAITVFTREDIEASGARSLPELLRQVPNMDVYELMPSWYAVGLRGRTVVNNDTLLLLVDGRDVTVEILGAPLWTFQPFSMDDVVRVEVIRGPGSPLYGANAYAGVVSVTTRRPDDDTQGLVSLRGGEHGMLEAALSAAQTFGPLALRMKAGMASQAMWSHAATPAKQVAHAGLAGKVDLGPWTHLVLDVDFVKASGRFFYEVGEATLGDSYNLVLNTRFVHDDLAVQVVYDRLDFEGDFGLVLYYPGLDMEIAELPVLHSVVDKVNLGAQHSVEFFHNRLTYGAEYVFHHYAIDIFVEPHEYEHRFGLFVQDELDLSGLIREAGGADIPPLVVTAGLRFDENSITDWEFSPRAAVVFVPFEHHSFRVGYAHAFQKPTFFATSLEIELLDIHDFGIDVLNSSSRDLQNETVDSFELGYSASLLDNRLMFRLCFAYNWYRNTIRYAIEPEKMNYLTIGTLRIPDVNGPGFGYVNDPAGQNGHNVEVEVIGRPTERSRIFLFAGYRQIFDGATGRFDPKEPVWQLGAGADLNGRDGWSLSVRAHYTDSFVAHFTSPQGVLVPAIESEVPDAWFLNARVAWELASDPFQLIVGLEGFNLLNSHFRQYGGVGRPARHDFGGEVLGRRIVLFLHGEI